MCPRLKPRGPSRHFLAIGGVHVHPNARWTGERPVRVSIQTPQLRGASASGGSEVRATFTRGNDAEVQASGGSVIKARGIDAARLSIQGSGGAVLEIAGVADAFDLQ